MKHIEYIVCVNGLCHYKKPIPNKLNKDSVWRVNARLGQYTNVDKSSEIINIVFYTFNITGTEPDLTVLHHEIVDELIQRTIQVYAYNEFIFIDNTTYDSMKNAFTVYPKIEDGKVVFKRKPFGEVVNRNQIKIF